MDAIEILQRDSQLIDGFLREAIAKQRAESNAPQILFEAIEYSLFAGGKRLRPALVIESFRACAPDADVRDVRDVADLADLADVTDVTDVTECLPAAAAIELIHTFSLVHDDLPAMDDDDLRRGRPTSHKVFGEAMAILAGDAMMTLAFEIISDRPDLTRQLAGAAGPLGMIGGQVRDIEGENQSLDLESLSSLHAMKTGALLRCAARMGAICAGASEQVLAQITEFASHLGLAFQIVDDLLDVTSTAGALGKQTRKDAPRGKNTYPALLGIGPARAQAAEEVSKALTAIRLLGPQAANLRALAQFTLNRSR